MKNVNYWQRVWFETHSLPYTCFFCDEHITKAKGQDSDSLNIHHVDGNHNNNAPENLVAMHHVCHVRHHNKGYDYRIRVFSVEARERIGAARRGKPSANRGKKYPRVKCACGREVAITRIKVHKCIQS